MHQFTSCLGTFLRGRVLRDLPNPAKLTGDFERYGNVSPVIRGSASKDAPYTRCDHFQQMTVGVAEVKRLSAIFPGLP